MEEASYEIAQENGCQVLQAASSSIAKLWALKDRFNLA